MKLLTPIFGGFAILMVILAFASYFAISGQSNRGTSVGFFVGTAAIFSVIAFISTFFNKQPVNTQTRVNANVRKVSLLIVVPVVLFIATLFLLAWWLGKGLTF